MDGSELPQQEDIAMVCSYCSRILDGHEIMENNAECQDNLNSFEISHGICPECLLENFPQEYLSIQKSKRIRIKNIYKQGYPEKNGKIIK